MIMSLYQRKKKFETRIKLYHNIYKGSDLTSDINFFSRYAYAIQKPSSLLFQ